VLIEHVNIENFDDAVAVKPCNDGCVHSSCSQNMTIRHANVTYGVGMTIGSVPPNVNHNCVRNITFEHIHFRRPIKAIYVKSNPGNSGDGLIENILYQHIYAEDSLWYFLWIGPQQQKQPHDVYVCVSSRVYRC
jgi:polygalacturonase